ncbi:MAG: 3-isopropylmalate dehydrogenase [Vulcanimicrobiaceae bacterium]
MSTIAVLPGDGIGVEVTAAALRVLQKLRPELEYVEGLVGAAALDREGSPYPAATQALCKRSSAILFGAVGDARYDGAPSDKRPEQAILRLRKEFDLFANLRPVKVLPGLEGASSLRPEIVRGIDLVVVRETTSGLYFGTPKGTTHENGVEVAVDTMVYRAPEVERIARVGFELARLRRKRVASVDKQNVLETGRLWRRVVTKLHADYPDVALEHVLVDNAAMQLLRDPKHFDVILTENTFGDILSDEAGMLTGSLGNLPSATLGSQSAGAARFGLYEPISGTAPDIAGKGVANPIAAILSAALMLRYSLTDETNATHIERAVESALAGGARTRDIARDGEAALGTEAFTDRVLAELAASVV